MTENEASVILNAELIHHSEVSIFYEALSKAIKALEEVQQYRQIGTVEECLRNKDFLDFLSDKMNPNDFEIYLSMYNSSSEKQEGERWED